MPDTTSAVPRPGSMDAQMRGCTCPIIDNGHGRGYRGQPDIFVITADCPVHFPPSPSAGDKPDA